MAGLDSPAVGIDGRGILMLQGDLFGGFRTGEPMPKSSGHGLRYYQQEAVSAIKGEFSRVDSTLAVLATGLGKTQCFCALASEWQGRVLMLADRDELVTQMADRYRKMFGEQVGREQGPEFCNGERIVVASLDTVRQPKRLERMLACKFTLAIIDEAHIAMAKTRRKVLDELKANGAKILGVTATPDRSDGKGLGAIFETVAYKMDILEGIEEGWLVPIEAFGCELPQLDLHEVKTTAGDFNVSQLEVRVVKAVEGIVKGVMQHHPDKKSILFFPGKKSAELACERFNSLEPGSTCVVTDSTPAHERSQTMRDIRAGKYKRFCNVQIAAKGFDWPEAELIVHGRPTKSRSLYAQMTGRGTRTAPGVTDPFPDKEDSVVRRFEISKSSKPKCIVMDFVGNVPLGLTQKIQTAEDLLGGEYSEEEVSLAKKEREKRPGKGDDVRQSLAAARALLRAQAKQTQSTVKCVLDPMDPFAICGASSYGVDVGGFGDELASENQVAGLMKWGYKREQLEGLTKRGASRLFNEAKKRARHRKCSIAQRTFLVKNGITKDVSFKAATDLIGFIIRHKRKPDDAMMQRIIEGKA